jgi:hypothetical protein
VVYITFAEVFGWSQQEVDASDEEVILDHLLNLKAKKEQREYDEKIEKMKQRLKDKSSRRT